MVKMFLHLTLHSFSLADTFLPKATFKKAHKARSVEFLERCKEDKVEKRRDQCEQRSPPVPPSPPGAPARLYPPQAHRLWLLRLQTCRANRRATLLTRPPRERVAISIASLWGFVARGIRTLEIHLVQLHLREIHQLCGSGKKTHRA